MSLMRNRFIKNYGVNGSSVYQRKRSDLFWSGEPMYKDPERYVYKV